MPEGGEEKKGTLKAYGIDRKILANASNPEATAGELCKSRGTNK